MPAKQYVNLHGYSAVVDEDTGEEKTFTAGEVYSGPARLLEVLLRPDHEGQDPDGSYWRGPLIAEKAAQAQGSDDSVEG